MYICFGIICMLIIYIYLDVSFKKKIHNSVTLPWWWAERVGVGDLVFYKFSSSIGVPDPGVVVTLLPVKYFWDSVLLESGLWSILSNTTWNCLHF